MLKVNWLGKALVGLAVANVGVYALNRFLDSMEEEQAPISEETVAQLYLAAQAGDVANFVAWYQTERPNASAEELTYAWNQAVEVVNIHG
jgi:hypothetical protein